MIFHLHFTLIRYKPSWIELKPQTKWTNEHLNMNKKPIIIASLSLFFQDCSAFHLQSHHLTTLCWFSSNSNKLIHTHNILFENLSQLSAAESLLEVFLLFLISLLLFSLLVMVWFPPLVILSFALWWSFRNGTCRIKLPAWLLDFLKSSFFILILSMKSPISSIVSSNFLLFNPSKRLSSFLVLKFFDFMLLFTLLVLLNSDFWFYFEVLFYAYHVCYFILLLLLVLR